MPVGNDALQPLASEIVPRTGVMIPIKPQRCRRPEACGWTLAEVKLLMALEHGHRENHRLRPVLIRRCKSTRS